jgi:eukaryotic-like serine/threonine-protein kinase
VSDCPSLDQLRRPAGDDGAFDPIDVDGALRAHLDQCPSCSALRELCPRPVSADRDDCARAEVLLSLSAISAPGDDDARFFRAHLLGCAACREIALEPPVGDAVPLPCVSPEVFILGSEIGRGGMGRVLAAHDRRIGRAVAIKEMLDAEPAAMVRFEWEARITARLQHPSIVSIYEVGRWPDGRPFYAMPILPGRTLREAIVAADRLPDRLALIPTVIAAADAAAYAHSRRIIHRDLTPSNILIGRFGETVVIDWGLAKDLDDEGTALTAVGSIVGTPEYSAPEQLQGKLVDERTDVYALGAILYQVLTGRLPYVVSSETKVEGPAARQPARMHAEPIPQELLSVAHKAMQPAMTDRYPTAQAFARELRQQQLGRPVDAHHYGLRERAARWLSRRLALVVTSAVMLALVAASAIIGGIQVVREQRRAAQTALALLQEQGRQELLAGRPARAFVYLSEAYHQGHRSFALQFLLAAASRSVEALALTLEWPAGQPSPSDLAFDATGDRLAVAHGDRIALWDARTGHLQTTIDGVDLGRVAFAHNGARLLTWGTGDADASPGVFPRARLWDIEDRQAVRIFTAPDGRATDVQLSADETTLLTAGDDHSFSLWDTQSAQQRFALGHREGTKGERIAFARLIQDGRQVITLDRAGMIAVRDARTGAQMAAWPSQALAVHSFEVSRDGTRAVIADGATGTRLWDLVKRGPIGPLGESPATRRAGFSPDGAHVLVVDVSREAQLLSADTGARTARLGLVSTYAFSPDSRRVATADTDGTFKVWLTSTGTLLDAYEGPHVPAQLVFSRDGRRLATAAARPPIQIWDLDKSALVRALIGPQAARLSGFVAGRGDVITTDRDANVRLWRLSHGAQPGPESLPAGRTLAITPDRTRVLQHSWLDPRQLRAHDLRSGRESIVLAAPSPVEGSRLSPDGTRLVTSRQGERVRLWETAAGREIRLSDRIQTGASASLAFSADGQRLFVHDGRQSDLWDPRDGRHVATIEAGSWPTVRAFFSPDGTALATTGSRSQVWNAADGRFRFSGETGARAVNFSRDSRHLALLLASPRGWSAQVAVVDARDGRVLASVDEPDVSHATFGPDGGALATIGRHVTSVWDWQARRVLARFAGEEPSAEQLVSAGTPAGEAMAEFTTLAHFNDASGLLAVSRGGHGVFLWDVHLETRDPKEIAAVGRRGWVPWRLQAGLLEFAPTPKSLADRGVHPQPSNLGFETGQVAGPPDKWAVSGSRLQAALSDDRPVQGRLCVRLDRATGDAAGYGALEQAIDAEVFRGRKLRLRAAVRTEGDVVAALWVGVERSNGRTSHWSSWWDLFDHPITSPDWAVYESVGNVDEDARSLTIGVVVKGNGKAWIDDVRLETVASIR